MIPPSRPLVLLTFLYSLQPLPRPSPGQRRDCLTAAQGGSGDADIPPIIRIHSPLTSPSPVRETCLERGNLFLQPRLQSSSGPELHP